MSCFSRNIWFVVGPQDTAHLVILHLGGSSSTLSGNRLRTHAFWFFMASEVAQHMLLILHVISSTHLTLCLSLNFQDSANSCTITFKPAVMVLMRKRRFVCVRFSARIMPALWNTRARSTFLLLTVSVWSYKQNDLPCCATNGRIGAANPKIRQATMAFNQRRIHRSFLGKIITISHSILQAWVPPAPLSRMPC